MSACVCVKNHSRHFNNWKMKKKQISIEWNNTSTYWNSLKMNKPLFSPGKNWNESYKHRNMKNRSISMTCKNMQHQTMMAASEKRKINWERTRQIF
jgi:hypothetical protein